MKKPFDKIIGPGGVWEYQDSSDIPWSPRDEFLLRCLNVVARSLVVLTYDQFVDLYNQRAKHLPPPISNPLAVKDLDGFFERIENVKVGDGSPLDKLLDEFGDLQATRWIDVLTSKNIIINAMFLEKKPPKGIKVGSLDHVALISAVVDNVRKANKKIDLFSISDEEFFALEDVLDNLEADKGGDKENDDYDEYDDYGEEESEEIRVEDLPPAKYTGPFDFKRVKDAKWREKVLCEYDCAHIAANKFIERVVFREMKPEERRDAAKRLGFEADPDTGFTEDSGFDMMIGDFASMMDDQHGEPAIKRVLKRKGELDELDRAVAEYFENYRYTWLEVLAVKSGLGLKCRDLLTGEELFLMDPNLSTQDVKGMTTCIGIAPMGEVYFALGASRLIRFNDPSFLLSSVLADLGVSSEKPVELSFADQARFAAMTINLIRVTIESSTMPSK